jgi:hypothetical protein
VGIERREQRIKTFRRPADWQLAVTEPRQAECTGRHSNEPAAELSSGRFVAARKAGRTPTPEQFFIRRNIMFIRKCAVLLVVLLACIGCASSPSATPSPLEGVWVAIEYISPGKLSGIFSDSGIYADAVFVQIFEGNRITRGASERSIPLMQYKFTFTDTEIKGKWNGDEYIIKYTLSEKSLLTEDDDFGKILWAKYE